MKTLFKYSLLILSIIIFESFVLDSGGEKTKEILLNNPLNTDETSLFAGAGKCVECHEATDWANNSATIGNVSATQLWQATMMANSARDPFWQAKVSAEVATFPQYKEQIEDKCITCHSPMGRTQKVHDDSTALYSLAEMNASGIAMDGNSCTVCHQIKDDNFGTQESYSGNYSIELQSPRRLYGPYNAQYPNFMLGHVQYFPEQTSHTEKSELCASCHTLITDSYDDAGNPVGEYFEQTNYIEWKNSSYRDQKVECQNCHLPTHVESIYQSSTPTPQDGLFPRDTTHLHYMVGGNTFMLQLLKDNATALGVTFTDEAMDSTIAETFRNLQSRTINMGVNSSIENDTLNVEVFLLNKTGHKFPTGYPARKSWLHVTVKDSSGNIYFESGEYDTNGVILDENISQFENHHDIITEDSQVQIYQQLAKDINGDLTFVLLKGVDQIKDNRIPPVGFTKAHASYDTVKIVGDANVDPNFNFENSVEGSGTDRVLYKIALSELPEDIIVETEMLYQSIGTRFAEHLFTFNTDEVNTFKPMYNAADKTPVVMASSSSTITLTDIGTEENYSPTSFKLNQNYPNPFNPTTKISFDIGKESNVSLIVYNLLGEKVKTLVNTSMKSGEHTVDFDASEFAAGVYIYSLRTDSFSEAKKMILLK